MNDDNQWQNQKHQFYLAHGSNPWDMEQQKQLM